MTEPIVEAKRVSKAYGRKPVEVRALKSVSLSLHPGKLTLLMGPSGSGKTTLLSILGCMLTPDAGTVRICGSQTEKANPEELARIRRSHIGFVFQSYHLFPTLTAAENVQLVLDIRGEWGRAAKMKSQELLAKVGLAHKFNSLPRELSGGEQQRVAIARAIVANPALILADEPTAALDGENGRAIMTIFRDIAREQGRAVLVVAHDARVAPFADKIIHIEDGSIAREERPNLKLIEAQENFRSGWAPQQSAQKITRGEGLAAASEELLTVIPGATQAGFGTLTSGDDGLQSVGIKTRPGVRALIVCALMIVLCITAVSALPGSPFWPSRWGKDTPADASPSEGAQESAKEKQNEKFQALATPGNGDKPLPFEPQKSKSAPEKSASAADQTETDKDGAAKTAASSSRPHHRARVGVSVRGLLRLLGR